MSQTFLHHIVVRGTISALTMFSAITTISEQSFAISMSGFTGVYAHSYWTKTGGATGNVHTNPSGAMLELYAGSAGQSIDYTIPIDSSQAGTLQFDWQLDSLDTEGNQGIGYLRNGNYTTVATWADNGNQSSQSPVTVEVAEGDIFGFRFLALQNTSSPGMFLVANFNFTPVPFETDALPAVISLSLFGAGVWLKRRKIGKTKL